MLGFIVQEILPFEKFSRKCAKPALPCRWLGKPQARVRKEKMFIFSVP